MPLDLSAVDRLAEAMARQEQQTAARPPDQSIGPWPYAAMIGGHAVDVGSTFDGWNRGLRESNQLIGDSPARLLAMKAGAGITTALLMRWLDKRGHDTAAKIAGYCTGAAMGAVGARNLTVGRD